MWQYRARLARVIDGDTYVLDIDLGFHVTVTERIRLRGIDCPEHGTPEGEAAKAFATQWFSTHPDLIISTERRADTEVKTFDRWVASVSAAPINSGLTWQGSDLATELRKTGHVKPVEALGRGLRQTPYE